MPAGDTGSESAPFRVPPGGKAATLRVCQASAAEFVGDNRRTVYRKPKRYREEGHLDPGGAEEDPGGSGAEGA